MRRKNKKRENGSFRGAYTHSFEKRDGFTGAPFQRTFTQSSLLGHQHVLPKQHRFLLRGSLTLCWHLLFSFLYTRYWTHQEKRQEMKHPHASYSLSRDVFESPTDRCAPARGNGLQIGESGFIVQLNVYPATIRLASVNSPRIFFLFPFLQKYRITKAL